MISSHEDGLHTDASFTVLCISHLYTGLHSGEHLTRLKWISSVETFRRNFAHICGFDRISACVFVFRVFVFFRTVALCADVAEEEPGRQAIFFSWFLFSKLGICRLVSFLAQFCRSAHIHICMRLNFLWSSWSVFPCLIGPGKWR